MTWTIHDGDIGQIRSGMENWEIILAIVENRHSQIEVWGVEAGTERRVEWDVDTNWIKVTEPE
jgi:hypothetical protein